MQSETVELLGTAEVAAVLGVSRKTVAAYLARGQMPEPDVKLACGPIWSRETLAAWLAKRDARVVAWEKRLAELEKRHEKVLRAIGERNRVAGARALQAGRNMRSRPGRKGPTISEQVADHAVRELELLIEQRSEVPAVRRLAAEFAEADQLRERIEARKLQAFERAVAS